MLEKFPEEMHLVDSAVCSFELQTSWGGFSENPPLDEAGFRVETLANGADCALILSPSFPPSWMLAVLWKQIILRNGGVLTNALNISCLSKVTDGFTQGQIVKVVKDVLTDRRIRQQAYKPLTGVEFITMMTSMNPVYKEEEECFKVTEHPASQILGKHSSHDLLSPSRFLGSMDSSPATNRTV